MNDVTLVLIMAKAPHAGRVKTRLCPPATPAQAARIAAAALLDTVDAVGGMRHARPVIALAGDLTDTQNEHELKQALRHIPIVAQRGATLGRRIAAAHSDAAALLPGHPILQIGMDTPQIDPELLETCQCALLSDGTDAVLGPATDGGWWILGLRDPHHAHTIADVPTSRPDTGKTTAETLRRHGLRLIDLPTLTDVDTPDDARRVAALGPATRFAIAVREIS
jgi:glycosyltransferase A (GT-A) superfamily protein (DUF2064 family)